MPLTADMYDMMINKVLSSKFSLKEHLQILPDCLANSIVILLHFLISFALLYWFSMSSLRGVII